MTDIQITPAPTPADQSATPAAAKPEQAAHHADTDAAAKPAFESDAPIDAPVVTVYAVHGMNCGHCASAVTRELSAIDGVTDVRVDLAAKKVTVGSTRDLAEDEVRAAVDEAGYELG